MEFENLKLKCECGGKMNKIKTDWHGIEVSTIPQPIMEAENLKEGQKMKWRIEDSRLVLTT